jgi:hypothetical protein
MGVPANYKPAAAPLYPYPANYPSLSPDTDPKYDLYGTSDVLFNLNDGSTGRANKADLHPWINNYVPSSWLFNTDASIYKVFRFSERIQLRVQCDFFNVFNQPGMSPTLLDETGVVTKEFSQNAPRQMQLSAKFSW